MAVAFTTTVGFLADRACSTAAIGSRLSIESRSLRQSSTAFFASGNHGLLKQISGQGQRLSGGSDTSAPRSVNCHASAGGEKMASQSRRVQVDATRVLAELLQAKELEATVRERVDDLSEEFFMVASAYVDMARKEGNPEVVQQLETVLKVAMVEKEKTLRPEIRMLNQLLRDKTPADRAKTLAAYEEYLVAGSYFFHLLNRMLVDVESQKPPQTKLLSQLRTINREVKEAAKGSKKGRKDSKSSSEEQ
ncbi:unnamed protein product [Closterium sp. Naga37s-1]|nr:unnamed protein product [Closterium sp. Naga37s-1]